MAAALKLYPYQKKWLQDKSRFKLGRFARQTGKTFTTTLEIVDDVEEAEALKRRSPWVILSRGERQAAEAMEEGVIRHANAYQMMKKGLVAREDYDFVDEDSGLRRRALILDFDLVPDEVIERHNLILQPKTKVVALRASQAARVR